MNRSIRFVRAAAAQHLAHGVGGDGLELG